VQWLLFPFLFPDEQGFIGHALGPGRCIGNLGFQAIIPDLTYWVWQAMFLSR